MLLTTKLDQRLGMSQQLTQAITLLQYNTLDLTQLVQRYLETNPLIDTEDMDIDTHSEGDIVVSMSNHDNESVSNFYQNSAEVHRGGQYYGDDSALDNYTSPKCLRDHLLEQTLLCKFNESQQIIAEAIIDALDEDGRLTMSLDEIQNKLGQHELRDMEVVLKKVQMLDPVGIAARDLQECLLIQLDHQSIQDEICKLAQTCVKDFFSLVADNNFKKLMSKLHVSSQQIEDAIQLIRTLNPKPGLLYSHDVHATIEPELYVRKIKSTWQVFQSESILTKIKVNKQYQDWIKLNKSHQSYAALTTQLQEAKWLLNGLKKRNETLLNVATHIMKMQHDFLEHGKSFMKPMNIIDVSQALNIHESTVSRVTTGKCIATPRGVFELKYFFPSYVLTQSGNTCSDTSVKEMIKEILQQESSDHIYSDAEITVMLKEKGINIARRTVAKYREALKILPSYKREVMHRSFPRKSVED
jgi:RNA polymerase sigma-54 factor